MSDHIHIYVDASFDLDGYSGAGGAVYQSDGTAYAIFSEQIDKPFLLTAMGSGQHTMIQELEMLALLIAAELWCPSSEGRRVVAFSDSESVRGSFLKGWSSNDPSSQVLRRILLLEERYSSHIWLERVPSQSNPSDLLSRSRVARWSGFQQTRVNPREIWDHAANSIG
jgi:ribonuclease HI